MRLEKITIVFLLDLVENQCTFSIFEFMRNKYAIGWGNICCLHVCKRVLYSRELFLCHYKLEKTKNANWCCHLKMGVRL